MAEDALVLQVFSRTQQGVRLDFCCRGGRWTHSVDLVDGSQLTPWLASQEGDDRDIWPQSPPLQQISCHTQPGGRRALLGIGMAGASHWSLSAEADPELPAVTVDVACRVKTSPEYLGSCYRSTVVPSCGEAADHGIVFSLPPFAARLVPLATPDHGTTRVEVTPEGIVVRPAVDPGNLPRTIRWKYRLSLATDLISHEP